MAANHQRFESLDVLRGIAILGILVMNIQSFSMPWPAYANPHAFGSLEGIHGWVSTVSHLFFDTKFYSLFALLFGAGIALMAEKAVAAARSGAAVHYRRMLFLAVVGLLHGFLLWYGDILFMYAVCGSFAWLLRNRQPLTQILIGAGFILFALGLSLLYGWSMQFWPEEVLAEMSAIWQEGSPAVQADIVAMSGPWLQQLPARAEIYLQVITFGLIFNVFWHATGLMLIGMALYRLGIVTAQRSTAFYLRLALVGLILGMTLVLYGLASIEARNWEFPWTKFVGRQFNATAAPLMALAYLSLVMIICQKHWLPRLRQAMSAVGRTAFSNYLLQTVLCTTLFYGHGLGLFGELERGQQVLVVLGVWAVQIPLSLWWLRHFSQGPVEWLWRSFVRLQWQPLRARSD
ncbi:DUF418 domain-containing protein [Gammaproteobacteria bacterium AB-CW1]|uniref:DUF418 domain-containing protein n=1 Tax=Natronospira elongata TaxID=3110268 RepID=A0AAP6MMC7_9GAMM|nr:DUF418 domain-containing protein [Gammaproteobacteria bacterium AB-CW1]